MTVALPPLPDPTLLADACRDAASRHGVQPAAAEKDFYLTRLIWALAQVLGEQALLKGGTCLSKVDLGYHRMSEDVDLVLPWSGSLRHRGTNASRTNRVRDALIAVAPVVGVRLQNADGEISERMSHRIWTLLYGSVFGDPARPEQILVEASMRPVLRPPRRAALRQLVDDPDVVGGYEDAYCWALDYDEVRAEKVRAAFTRDEPAIRDFYDLRLLADAGADMSSDGFVALTDQKLAEESASPLAEQPPGFALTPAKRRNLDTAGRRQLTAVVRVGEPAFDLDGTIAHYDALWRKGG
jgi:hypothetical protein